MRTRSPVLRAVVVTSGVIGVWLSRAAAVAQDTSACPSSGNPLIVLVSPRGSDANDGLSLDAPILTIERAQQIVRERVPDRDRAVQIRIAPGVYRNQSVRWNFTMPTQTITFMPLFDDKERPQFIGSGRGTWFTLEQSKGERTNIVFRYLDIQKYGTAISLEGDRDSVDAFNSDNQIYGCQFRDVGEGSTAAVRLVNSRHNSITNNHFVNILSAEKCGNLHAIYIAHLSSDNSILRNEFRACCGDPVRVRDSSNRNAVNENRFVQCGKIAAFTDWYCDHDTRKDCTKDGPECPSWQNEVHENVLTSNYANSRLGAFHLYQDDDAKGCAKPTDDPKRVLTTDRK